MTRRLWGLGLSLACALACGNGNIPLGSLDGGGSPWDIPSAGVPPIGGDDGCGAASRCWALRMAYDGALQKARSCNPTAGDPCSARVVDSLGCSTCEIYVNDVAPLAPLRQQFVQAGCDRCLFTAFPFGGSPQPATRCPVIPCAVLSAPTCSPNASISGGDPTQGSCGGATLNTCPAGVTSGSACSSRNQYCLGGAANACLCGDDGTWECS
jgi:hypothetical protein